MKPRRQIDVGYTLFIRLVNLDEQLTSDLERNLWGQLVHSSVYANRRNRNLEHIQEVQWLVKAMIKGTYRS